MHSFTGSVGDAVQPSAPLLGELELAPLTHDAPAQAADPSGIATYYFGSNFIAIPFMQ